MEPITEHRPVAGPVVYGYLRMPAPNPARRAALTAALAGYCDRHELVLAAVFTDHNDDDQVLTPAFVGLMDALAAGGYGVVLPSPAHLLGVEIPYGEEFNRRKVLPADLDTKVIAAWRESGITTPLFRKTSCGVSAAHGVADYNGHWGVRELCDICPTTQRDICATAHRPPSDKEFEAVLADLGYTTDHLVDGGHIWTHGLGEQRRYAIQHTLGFQIWELDQPHFLHAHGRSLVGNQPADDEQGYLTALRERFTAATRFDEED